MFMINFPGGKVAQSCTLSMHGMRGKYTIIPENFEIPFFFATCHTVASPD